MSYPIGDLDGLKMWNHLGNPVSVRESSQEKAAPLSPAEPSVVAVPFSTFPACFTLRMYRWFSSYPVVMRLICSLKTGRY